MTTTRTRLDSPLLDLAVQGRNILGPALGDNLAAGPTLIAFLRHLG